MDLSTKPLAGPGLESPERCGNAFRSRFGLCAMDFLETLGIKKTASKALVFLIVLPVCCKGKAMNPLDAWYEILRGVPQQTWTELAQKRIFFGHQSVGQNIIEGLEKVLRRYPEIGLTIQEIPGPQSFQAPMLAHSRIGQNRDPMGKINHFYELLRSGIGRSADIAFFKFCYVDIVQGTEIGELLGHFNEVISQLKSEFRGLIIIPTTVPLTNKRPGLKAWLKRRLGLEPDFKADNIMRNIVNEQIRKTYGPAIWDLADIEASTAGGSKTTFSERHEVYHLLNPSYTSDGGHLNDVGSQIVAIDLLLRLAALCRE